MRDAIPLRMIGQEIIPNNNIICVFFEKINLFQLNKYDQPQQGAAQQSPGLTY